MKIHLLSVSGETSTVEVENGRTPEIAAFHVLLGKESFGQVWATLIHDISYDFNEANFFSK